MAEMWSRFGATFEYIYGRIVVFSTTRNGPELDAETSELGPDLHLYERRG